jgi:type VI secretion system protein ImpE
LNADALFKEGRLSEAIEALNQVLRADPTDVRSRTFLFELLCFSGAFERARRQLDAIGTADPELHLTAAWYQEALVAEEKRHEMFKSGELPDAGSSPSPVRGTLNGKPFADLRDGDPRIGFRLEIIVGGRYTWMPLEHLATLSMEPPKRLRDLYWAPVQIETTEALDGYAGEALLPIMTPLAWQDPDDAIRLGRQTDWIELESGEEAPVGQKLLLVDDEEFPLLEVRELLVHPPDR